MRPRQKLGIGIAGAYWLFLIGLYFYIPFGDPGISMVESASFCIPCHGG